MDELIKTFHIDWKLLVAQIINFAIVLWVLYRFALKPLMKAMDKRSHEIAKSLDDAKKIESNLMMSNEEREAKIQEAKKEAAGIIESARGQGQKQAEEMIDKAKDEVKTVITEAKDQINNEKEVMLKEVKQEVGDLVVKTTKKVLVEVVDGKVDSDLIKKSLDNIK